jgi:hypothetical protein
MRTKTLATAAAIIDQLGGTTAFAKWWGVHKAVVHHWKLKGFPSSTYVMMAPRLLKEHGIVAETTAWTFQHEPPDTQSPADTSLAAGNSGRAKRSPLSLASES